MHHTDFPPGVLAAAMSACATESLNLNSERIEQRFGSYGIDVLASEAGLRRASLYSVDGDTQTCRTYAIVRFADSLDARCAQEHSKVLAGKSIGAIFRDKGWDILKKTLHIGHVRLPETSNQVRQLMRLSGAHDLGLHVYQLVLARDAREFEYATILETHHPEYLSEDQLHELFGTTDGPSLPATDAAALADLVINGRSQAA